MSDVSELSVCVCVCVCEYVCVCRLYPASSEPHGRVSSLGSH